MCAFVGSAPLHRAPNIATTMTSMPRRHLLHRPNTHKQIRHTKTNTKQSGKRGDAIIQASDKRMQMQPKRKRRRMQTNTTMKQRPSTSKCTEQSKQGHGRENRKKQTRQANICYGMWWWFRHSPLSTQGNVLLEFQTALFDPQNSLSNTWQVSLLPFLFTPMENHVYDDSRVIENKP